MTKKRMRPVQPGEIIREDVLKELGMSANAFAKAIGVPANRVTAILHGRRGITVDTAMRIARYLGGSPQFWLDLQTAHDLRVAETAIGPKIERSVRPRAA